jgi:hypothetical protein
MKCFMRSSWRRLEMKPNMSQGGRETYVKEKYINNSNFIRGSKALFMVEARGLNLAVNFGMIKYKIDA